MNCPECGYQLGPFEQACPKCADLGQTRQMSGPGSGSMVPDDPAQAFGPAQTLPSNAPYKVCTNCGQPAVLTMDACRRCGQPFPPLNSTFVLGYGLLSAPEGQYSPQRANRSLAYLVVGALLFTLIAAAVLAFTMHNRAVGSSGLLLIDQATGPLGGGLAQAPAVDAEQFENRLLQSGAVTGGEVEVSLAWNTLTDLDIQVRDPYGELISANHPRSSHGGAQDVDANPTPITMEGDVLAAEGKNPGVENVLPIPEMLVDIDRSTGFSGGSTDSLMPDADGKAPARYTHTPVEHIYFSQAPTGIYTVYAHCYMWREPDSTPLPFTVEIRSHGKVFHQVTSTIGPGSYITTNAGPIQVCQFEVR